MPFSQDFRWLSSRDHELHERADKLMWSIWGHSFANAAQKRSIMRPLNLMLNRRNSLSQEILRFRNMIKKEGRMGEHPTGKDREKIQEFRRRHTELGRDIRNVEKKYQQVK